MKVEWFIEILITVSVRNKKSVHTSFTDRSAWIFLETAVFIALDITFASFIYFLIANGGILFYYYLKCHLCRDRDTSFFYRCWTFFDSSILVCFGFVSYLLCFIFNWMKWSEERVYSLTSSKEAHISLAVFVHHTALNWAKPFLRPHRCVYVCVCRFHVPDGKISVQCVCVCAMLLL